VDLLSEARRRLEAGDPRSAHALAARALEAGRIDASRETVGAAAHLVGESLYVIGDVDGSRVMAEEALRANEEIGNRAAVAGDLNLIGVLDLTVGDADSALVALRRSLELRTAELGPDDPETIESLNNLAVALWRSGEEDEALRLHEDALARCERALGEDHRRTAETLNALAVKVQSRPDRAERARELYERALASAEAAHGPDSELVARLLANVATAHMNDGDLDGAGPLLQRSLELHERHFGPSRWTSYVLVFAGEHAWAEGRMSDAREHFERAFVIRVNELGATDQETLDAAMGLASVLGELGGSGGTVVAESPAVTPESDTMEQLTALYLPLAALHPELQGTVPIGAPDLATAEAQLKHVAERIASRVAPDPSQLETIERARATMEEADAAYLAGDLEPATRLLDESIATLEGVYGSSDTALVEPLQRLKLVHRIAGTESAVLPILRRIGAILADAYGEIHPLAIRALGEVYWQERREYGPGGGRATATRVEELVHQALGRESSVAQFLQSVFDAAREAADDVEPWDPPLSARREAAMSRPSPLVAELLGDLDETPWPSLWHAYGPALDTPVHLRLLLAEDELVRADALQLLTDSLLGSDEPTSVLAPATTYLGSLAEDERVPERERIAELVREARALAGSA
jgi:tetratricopeptide (TPR) repeat protein